MNFYVLHYAMIDEDGRLSINCQGPFKTLEEAKKRQATVVSNFLIVHHSLSNELLEEKCGTFHRIAFKDNLNELQIHIEAFERLI